MEGLQNLFTDEYHDLKESQKFKVSTQYSTINTETCGNKVPDTLPPISEDWSLSISNKENVIQ